MIFAAPYPQDPPIESVKEIYRIAFADRSLDREYPAAAHEGWWVAGYGLKVSLGEGTATGKFGAGLEEEACSDDEAQQMMASLIQEPDPGKFAALPINWLGLAMWILQNIILKKK